MFVDSDADLKHFKSNIGAVAAHAKEIESKIGNAIDFQIQSSRMEREVTTFFKERMREHIKDERLLEGLEADLNLGSMC